MKTILILGLLASFKVLAAGAPSLTSLAKQGNFFPGQVIPKNYQCPVQWQMALQDEVATCNNTAASPAANFNIEYLRNSREIIRLTARVSTTCAKAGLTALKEMAAPCALLAQDSSNIGKEKVYTISCDDFVNGEITCKPNRIDFALGYSETHRALLRDAQASQATVVLDGQTYLRPLQAPKVHKPKGTNSCYRQFNKAVAVAVIRRSGSKVMSNEFYCRPAAVSGPCPKGMVRTTSKLTDTPECQSGLRPLEELCENGNKISLTGTQKIGVTKEGYSIEYTELKKDCHADICYPNTLDSGDNCLLCPPGSSYNPAFKPGSSEAVCLKNN